MDRRVRKTRESLKKALIKLLYEKGFEGVTVHNITETADVNRGTFYHHYMDKYDLLEKTIEEMIERLKNTVTPYEHPEYKLKIAPATHAPQNVEDIDAKEASRPFVRLFNQIKEERYFYESMFSTSVYQYFYPRFIEVLYPYFEKGFAEQHEAKALGVDKELLIHYILFANLGVLHSWIRGGMKKSPEYMGDQLRKLLTMAPFELQQSPFQEYMP